MLRNGMKVTKKQDFEAVDDAGITEPWTIAKLPDQMIFHLVWADERNENRFQSPQMVFAISQ